MNQQDTNPLLFKKYDNIIDENFIKLIMSKIESNNVTPSPDYNAVKELKPNSETTTISIKYNDIIEPEINDNITKLISKINEINYIENIDTNFMSVGNNLDIIQYSVGVEKHQDFVNVDSNMLRQYVLIMCVERTLDNVSKKKINVYYLKNRYCIKAI